MHSLLLGAAVVVGVPAVLLAYLHGVEWVLARVGSRRRYRSPSRPWFWLVPALCLMGAILGYPLVQTIRLSFAGPSGTGAAGWSNYSWATTSSDSLAAIRNSLLWLVLLPTLVVAFGLLIAALVDRVRYQRLAKSIIVIPTAISFVAAAAVWELVYAYQGDGLSQIGLLNAIWVGLGAQAVPWLVDSHTNTLALIAVGVWMYVGFATLVLSAAMKVVPEERFESARIDGASEWQVYWHVVLPGIRPAIAMVAVTTIAWALKIFDIVYVATGGNFGTDVVGTKVYEQLFTYFNIGRGSALAVLLFLAALPVMIVRARAMDRNAL